MSKKNNLLIKNPCKQNYTDFVPIDKGGYCNSCKKNVIDFRMINNQEIANYFDSKNESTCGIFFDYQLKMYPKNQSPLRRKKIGTVFSGLFSISFLSLLTISSGFAQEKDIKNKTVKIESDSITKKDMLTTSPNQLLKGKVFDKQGPLPGVTLYLERNNISIRTDIDGKFTFPEALNNGDIVVVSLLGYKDKKLIVNENNLRNNDIVLDVEMKVCEFLIMGKVVTNKIYKSKRNFFWQRITSLFAHD